MENSKEFVVFIFDKKDQVQTKSRSINGEETLLCRISGFNSPVIMCENNNNIGYFKADSDVSIKSDVYFVYHELVNLNDEFINHNNDKITIKDAFFNNLPEKIRKEKEGKKVVIAGHWGDDTLQGYKQKCRRANQNQENIEKNIYLSYYGSQLKNINTDKIYNEVIDNQIINKILLLAGLIKSPQQIKCQLINTFLPFVIDVQGLNEITGPDKRKQYREEVKEHITKTSNETFSQWQKIKNDIVNYVSLNDDEKNILYCEPIGETADNPAKNKNYFITELLNLFNKGEWEGDEYIPNWLNCAAKTLDAKIKQ